MTSWSKLFVISICVLLSSPMYFVKIILFSRISAPFFHNTIAKPTLSFWFVLYKSNHPQIDLVQLPAVFFPLL